MTFTYQRTVYLSDTDAAGVVYFAQALSMCHEAYEESLLSSGVALNTFYRSESVAVPVVHAQINFLRPLFAGDRLLIRLSARSLSDSEFEITYQIVAASPQELMVKASTHHVCINLNRRRITIPQALQQWLIMFEDS